MSLLDRLEKQDSPFQEKVGRNNIVMNIPT